MRVRILDSSVHRALGVTGPLDFMMIREAVQLQQREDQGLDWKELVGDAADVAADVAAMANARGGLLVYGVRENRSTSGAEELRPIDISDAAVRGFRSKLYARLNPPIPGLVVAPIPDPESDGTIGVLVVQVPESPESPHVVGAKKNLGVPYRTGSQTEWMAEWEIERAYQERFTRRLSDSNQLDVMIADLEDHLDLSQGCWIAGSSRPTVPHSRTVDPPSRGAAVQATSEAVRLSMRLYPYEHSAARPLLVSDEQGVALLNPRAGLRRWVMRDRRQQVPEEGSFGTHLELHHDGSVVFAQRLDGWEEAELEKHFVPEEFIVGYAIDFVALLGVMASRLGTGHTLLRLRLLREDTLPFALLAPERVGHLRLASRQPPWTTDLRRFLAVDNAFPNHPQMGDSDHLPELRSIAKVIAGDVISQFGYSEDDISWPPAD